MAEQFIAVRDYLLPDRHSFWRWSDEAEVILWSGGQTVVFREELEGVLRRLAPGGLPPLDAVVLLLGACRDTWRESALGLGAVCGLLISLELNDWPDWFSELFSQLDTINALPKPLRATSPAKAALAEIVFETCPKRTSPAVTEGVLETLRNGLSQDIQAGREDGSGAMARLTSGFRTLFEGLNKVDPDALELRLRTGLDRLVEPADVEIDPAQAVREMISQLQDDRELGGLARMARHLLATVHLPRPLDRQEDLPVGGVSDITNRGSLDRLLLSELAHDDLTLAVRVAVNEALYLRRESPPKNPPRGRVILLDAGIRLWGVPRVFGAAIAMALAATNDRRAECHVYRAEGQGVRPVDLRSRQGLIEHLAALRSEAHPGAALPALLKEIDRRCPMADVVLVTGEDVLADRRFQLAMGSVDIPLWYLATTDRDGRFRLRSRSVRGTKTLREARLELDKLLAEGKRPSTPLIDESRKSLPAIFSAVPFPLLLPHPPNPKRSWSVPGQGVFSVTKDRRLMWWKSRELGATQLAEDLPPGNLLWAKPLSLVGRIRAMVGRLQQGKLSAVAVDLNTGEYTITRLDVGPEPARAVCEFGSATFVVYSDRVEAFETVEGRKIQSLKLPVGLTHHRDRFFHRDWREWFALSYDGLTVSLQEVPVSQGNRRLSLETLFDRVGHSGMVGVTIDGDLYFTEDGSVRKIPHEVRGRIQVLAVSRGGERVVMAQESGLRGRERQINVVNVVHVDSGKSARARGTADPALLAEPELARAVFSKTLRRCFQGVLVDTQGRLTLISSKGRAVYVELRQGDILFHQPPPRGLLSNRQAPSRMRPFRRVQGPSATGYTLSVATWPNGSQVFLDSRGLLHLKSADPNLLEATLVLYEGAVSGWCSDGRVWGSRYFTGEAGASPTEIYHEVIHPFVKGML